MESNKNKRISRLNLDIPQGGEEDITPKKQKCEKSSTDNSNNPDSDIEKYLLNNSAIKDKMSKFQSAVESSQKKELEEEERKKRIDSAIKNFNETSKTSTSLEAFDDVYQKKSSKLSIFRLIFMFWKTVEAKNGDGEPDNDSDYSDSDDDDDDIEAKNKKNSRKILLHLYLYILYLNAKKKIEREKKEEKRKLEQLQMLLEEMPEEQRKRLEARTVLEEKMSLLSEEEKKTFFEALTEEEKNLLKRTDAEKKEAEKKEQKEVEEKKKKELYQKEYETDVDTIKIENIENLFNICYSKKNIDLKKIKNYAKVFNENSLKEMEEKNYRNLWIVLSQFLKLHPIELLKEQTYAVPIELAKIGIDNISEKTVNKDREGVTSYNVISGRLNFTSCFADSYIKPNICLFGKALCRSVSSFNFWSFDINNNFNQKMYFNDSMTKVIQTLYRSQDQQITERPNFDIKLTQWKNPTIINYDCSGTEIKPLKKTATIDSDREVLIVSQLGSVDIRINDAKVLNEKADIRCFPYATFYIK